LDECFAELFRGAASNGNYAILTPSHARERVRLTQLWRSSMVN